MTVDARRSLGVRAGEPSHRAPGTPAWASGSPASLGGAPPRRSAAQRAARVAHPSIPRRGAPRGDPRPVGHRRLGRAGDGRGRRRAFERPAGPEHARLAHVRPADEDLRPDRRSGARHVPAREAPCGDVRRRAPPRRRRDDDRGGPLVLGERRLRPGGDPGGGRRERERRERARSVDDHPAARSGPAPAGPRDVGRLEPLRPEGQGAHPGGAADDDLPGRGRQGRDRHRLPERDLLRPRRIRGRGRRRDLLRRHEISRSSPPPRPRSSPDCRNRRRRSTPTGSPRPTPRVAWSSRGPRRPSSAATGSSTTSRRRAGRSSRRAS